MKILRETTTYSKVDYEVPQHDYLVEGGHGGRLIAMRKKGSEDWEKFAKPLPFGKKHRTFKQLREPIPTEFVKPYMTRPFNLEIFLA